MAKTLFNFLSFFICIISNISSQISYFRVYPELIGCSYNHILKNDALILLKNKVDLSNTGFERSIVHIDPATGDIFNEIELSLGNFKGNSHSIIDWKNFYFTTTAIEGLNSVTAIQISKINKFDFNEITSILIPISDPNFISSENILLNDTLIVFIQTWDLQSNNVVHKVIIPLSDLNQYSVSQYKVYYLAPSSFLKIQNEKCFLMYAYDGIYKLNDTLGTLYSGPGPIGRIVDTPFIRRGGIITANDSGYVIFGNALADFPGQGRAMSIAKMSNNNVVTKKSTFSKTNKWFESTLDNTILSDGNNYFGGYWDRTSSIVNPFYDTIKNQFSILKFDIQLNTLWEYTLANKKHLVLVGILPDSIGGCYAYGFLRDSIHDYEAIPFLLRIASDGTVTSTNEAPNSKPASLTVYGNPSSTLRFYFDGNDNEKFRLTCANSKGQTLLTQFIQNGIHEVNTSAWSAGMYYLTFYDENGSMLFSQQWIKE